MSTKVERPISPHVTIYNFPVTALTSITNRATGVGMSVGVIGMSMVALGGGCDIPAYVETIKVTDHTRPPFFPRAAQGRAVSDGVASSCRR